MVPGRRTVCSMHRVDVAMYTCSPRPLKRLLTSRAIESMTVTWDAVGMSPTRVRFVLCGPLPPTRLRSSSSDSPSHSKTKQT